jgi:hypothetical protein
MCTGRATRIRSRRILEIGNTLFPADYQETREE